MSKDGAISEASSIQEVGLEAVFLTSNHVRIVDITDGNSSLVVTTCLFGGCAKPRKVWRY